MQQALEVVAAKAADPVGEPSRVVGTGHYP
jgi:hypothetical protein